MAVLNYKLGPWDRTDSETRPFKRRRGQNRKNYRRAWRRVAKRADNALWRSEIEEV